MGISSLRSLLLAAIVLSNCITWTASRHHYTHNVNGHRSRHRRQGAGLFLPASYIIPGGEGGGAWGEWGEVSPCSRTCGGGVASQKRICLEVSSDGQPLCRGGDTKYFSCQTQDCPEGSGDFRAEQCAEFDDQVFRDNRKYTWVPYTKGHNPCELNCMPRGERFYFRQRSKVVDGTRCNDESFDVCVNGTCQPVGCDMMLGSNAREDKCRECRGNGTNCSTMQGLIDDPDLRRGYNDVLLIPQGATNIFIEEIRASSNYLALRAKENTKYYLNGDYHIDFPRSLPIAGAQWHYARDQQGFAAPDRLRCIGPTTEPLYLALLLQEDNVGVRYEYSIPSDMAPRPELRYDWVFDKFSPCSDSCGGGFQTRNVSCRSRDDLELVEENLCEAGLKPATNQTCNTQACQPRWVEGPWSPCSKPCGEDGTRSREVRCEKIITNGVNFRFASVVSDKECFNLLKPNLYEECNRNATCPTWFTGPWKPCDKLCDEGKQTRQVVCHTKTNGRVQVFDDELCSDEKPSSEQPCNLHPCGGVDWLLSEWSGCDTCLSKSRTRLAKCATANRTIVALQLCGYHPAPLLEEPCDRSELPKCDAQWYATQWGKCSVECGKGEQSRRVFCGVFDGSSVVVVEDDQCDQETKYRDTKPCEVPEEKCPAKWFAGPWTECNKKCGGGEQTRKVMCLIGDQEVLEACHQPSIPELLRSCNMGPCNEDEMLPVDSKSTPIMDDYYYDYDECEDEGYTEVGAEADFDTSKTIELDMMFSDSPSTFEEGSGEDEFTLETGSGSEPTTEATNVTDSTSDMESAPSPPLIKMNYPLSSTLSTEKDEEEEAEIDYVITPAPPEGILRKVTKTIESGSGSEPTETDEFFSTISTSEEITESIGSTETTETSDESTSESTIATDTSITGSETETEVTESVTESFGSTESTITETGITELNDTEITDYTDTTNTDISTKEEESTSDLVTESDSTITEVSGSTTESATAETEESSVTDSGSSATAETEVTSTTESESSTTAETEITSSTDSESSATAETEETVTTESSVSTTVESETVSTTESGSSTIAETESAPTTESGSSSTVEVETVSTTESASSTTVKAESTSTTESASSTTTESESTSTTESGSSITEETESTSTTESGSSTTADTESAPTTESGSSTTAETELFSSTESGISTTAETEETTESSTKAESEQTSTSESSSTETTESSSGSTDISGSTEPTESSSTEPTTESGSTESTELTSPETTETMVTESSTAAITTESGIKSPKSPISKFWGPDTKPVCKPRKRAKCLNTKFGCCPDKRTPAKGPFDEGCPNPKTCKETKFGCCSDGVSPAAGPKDQGCPVVPCKETLYGCCASDNTTPAEGNDQEGCPKPVPECEKSKYGCCKDGKTEAKGLKKEGCPEAETPKPEAESESTLETKTDTTPESTSTESETTSTSETCADSEFGCCADNSTLATGPDGAGCPCDLTEFGCCPDGVSPAVGAHMEGCVLSCNTSAFGCCADGKTPAHGPQFEGCCLLYAFGCCPDNYRPADGPHLEGCGCEFAHFGCCPDNVTIARGPNGEGCGCQYTPFGCCPDRHTEAQGPNFEGCDCSTFQFGCCPDGRSAARGPNLQGCHCQQTEFGCCGDEKTAAQGPDKAGCDCSTSKYGCCPDGVTEAKGEKFLNCTDIPENRQAACALATDRGPCRNFTVYWFYDMTYGGCSRFWYGGCEGNGNRFLSKEECEDVCVQPSPKDACKLPKVKGACHDRHVRWYYDAAREQCGQFEFGGCLGNANNFESRELCQKQCEPATTENQCSLPIERGPCAGNFGRWGFTERGCEQFVWGGCGGNANRFGSEAACLQRCDPPGVQKPECSLPQAAGNCTDKMALWSFSVVENRCVPFYYSGCGGNDNRFDSEAACTQNCPSAYAQDTCVLPALTGDCADYTLRWFFDTSEGRCRQFYYGGCGGNENNFMTEQECMGLCTEQPTTTPTTTSTTTLSTTAVPTPAGTGVCYLEVDPGPCTAYQPRWAFDAARGQCVPFEFGGCGGNGNNFADKRTCLYYCAQTRDICQLEPLPGPCNNWTSSWYYDASEDSCQQFMYGGCGGNENRFDSQEACESQCRKRPAPPATTTTTTTTVAAPIISSQCRVSPTLEECVAAGRVWYLDESQVCVPFDNAESGARCRRTGTYSSQEACERACGAFQNLDVCRYPVEPGPCGEAVPKVYYDAARGRCEPFAYGGCLGGPNRFSTVQECEQVCKPQIDPCKQTPEAGNCVEYYIMWYYDELRDDCGQFAYTGCGGNDNRFESQAACLSTCQQRVTTTARPTPPAVTTVTTLLTTSAPVITTTVTPLPPIQQEHEECRTPDSLEPCGENITTYYYDTRTGACVRGDFGGCGYANSYKSEEACERQCGAFRGMDVCRAELDPGPCVYTVPKVFWDAASGRCLNFAFGGCNGGPNRFSTVEECEEVCGGMGPEAECLLEVSVGAAGCGQPARRWRYDAAAADCRAFVYLGCGGNANNFRSYAACRALCRPDVDYNRVPDCERYEQECATIRCGANQVNKTRTWDGCVQCSCTTDVCEQYKAECERLNCSRVEITLDSNGCERCGCKEGCDLACPAGERCVETPYRDPITGEARTSPTCAIINKPGECPVEPAQAGDAACAAECADDAGCPGAGKCCARGCARRCLPPARPATAPPTTTYIPEDIPRAPEPASPSAELPPVRAAEGGKATLRCLFHGNPPPSITWRHGEITIESDMDRYRLLSDGALEIVSIYRNDSGVYICIANNPLGNASQEVHLVVSDPENSPAGIAGVANAVVTGEAGRAVNIRCLAYGFPPPTIYWYRGRNGPMVPYSSALYEARGNVLQIRSLIPETLGEYICTAYNGNGKPAVWSVTVQTRQQATSTTPERQTDTTSTTSTTTEILFPVYTVPVKTRIVADRTTVYAGAEVNIPCAVDGYPLPDVYWTKDSVRLVPTDRMTLTDARLTIANANINDSGVYGCHASNPYSSHFSTVQITVEGLYIPPKCTDNPYFANCALIVRSKFCKHQYYSRFCCKSCVESGQLNPMELDVQADEAWRKRK